MRRSPPILLAALAGAVLAGCLTAEPPAPSQAAKAPAIVDREIPPAELAPILDSELRLLTCLQERADEVAAALSEQGRFPLRMPSDDDCLRSGVDEVLGLALPQARPGAAWKASLDEYQQCRGILAFAVTSSEDLGRLSGESEPGVQATWLREHLGTCRVLLSALRDSMGVPA